MKKTTLYLLAILGIFHSAAHSTESKEEVHSVNSATIRPSTAAAQEIIRLYGGLENVFKIQSVRLNNQPIFIDPDNENAEVLRAVQRNDFISDYFEMRLQTFYTSLINACSQRYARKISTRSLRPETIERSLNAAFVLETEDIYKDPQKQLKAFGDYLPLNKKPGDVGLAPDTLEDDSTLARGVLPRDAGFIAREFVQAEYRLLVRSYAAFRSDKTAYEAILQGAEKTFQETYHDFQKSSFFSPKATLGGLDVGLQIKRKETYIGQMFFQKKETATPSTNGGKVKKS